MASLFTIGFCLSKERDNSEEQPSQKVVHHPLVNYHWQEDMTTAKVTPPGGATVIKRAINVRKTRVYNVVLIGESRSGKTQFIKMIENMETLGAPEFFAGTKVPEKHQLTIELNDDELITINFIDTPGVNELGKDGVKRSNTEIHKMISKFVKDDITTINMMLITWNGSDMFTEHQISALVDMVLLIGQGMNAIAGVLVTHYERMEEKEEKKWVDLFQNHPSTNVLNAFAQLGYFFTGCMTSDFDEASKSKFRVNQVRRNLHFLDKLVNTVPRKLSISDNGSIQSILDTQETLLTDYINYESWLSMLPGMCSTSTTLMHELASLALEFKDTDDEQLKPVIVKAQKAIEKMDVKRLEVKFDLPNDIKERVIQYKVDQKWLKHQATTLFNHERFLTSFNAVASDIVRTIKVIKNKASGSGDNNAPPDDIFTLD